MDTLYEFLDFTILEKKNLALYALGMIFYKFSLETMNVCLSGIVLNRIVNTSALQPGVVWTSMQAFSLLMQCVGSIVVGPLVKKIELRKVLVFAVGGFGLSIFIVPIMEYFTGGTIPGPTSLNTNPYLWGSWNPLLLFLVVALSGIFYGMVELLRRVLPCSVVGSDALKLRKMDALIHIVYEIAGTLGALFSVVWVSYFGWSYALCLLTIGFFIASVFFGCLQLEQPRQFEKHEGPGDGMLTFLQRAIGSFLYSIKLGAKLVFSHRDLAWLLPAYTLPLVIHRYFENTILSFYAKSVLHSSDLQVIMLGGSNFGELLGALCVLLLSSTIRSPLVYLRVDAILLLFIWVLVLVGGTGSTPYLQAWSLTPIMLLISLGWAAGDVSLGAYIQSKLSDREDEHTSPLGAVMAFLYCSYLLSFFILNISMGRVYDHYKSLEPADVKMMFVYIAGVLFTLCSMVVIASTFIPHGSCAIFPDSDGTCGVLKVTARDDYIELLEQEETDKTMEMKL